MDEAKKTNEIRGLNFFKNYIKGRVIDIGAGRDLVSPNSERFDLEEGDANHITDFREIGVYDKVHSSHCLEHMHKPQEALLGWWKLLKEGGYLILVVPDEDLYEQGFWPSRFNKDHKVTFTLKKEKGWSPVSFNILDLVSNLPGSEIVSVDLHDINYDYNLQTKYPPPESKKVPVLIKLIREIAHKPPIIHPFLRRKIQNLFFRLYHIPVDQSKRDALAQIQIVARKNF
jgi:SAM-dependent methyltransferase